MVNTDECWLYAGELNHNGYGRLQVKIDGHNRNFKVHRLSYQKFVGDIPDGLHIDHLCKIRSCLNPDHLEAVTQLENNHRSYNVLQLRAPDGKWVKKAA